MGEATTEGEEIVSTSMEDEPKVLQVEEGQSSGVEKQSESEFSFGVRLGKKWSEPKKCSESELVIRSRSQIVLVLILSSNH